MEDVSIESLRNDLYIAQNYITVDKMYGSLIAVNRYILDKSRTGRDF